MQATSALSTHIVVTYETVHELLGLCVLACRWSLVFLLVLVCGQWDSLNGLLGVVVRVRAILAVLCFNGFKACTSQKEVFGPTYHIIHGNMMPPCRHDETSPFLVLVWYWFISIHPFRFCALPFCIVVLALVVAKIVQEWLVLAATPLTKNFKR